MSYLKLLAIALLLTGCSYGPNTCAGLGDGMWVTVDGHDGILGSVFWDDAYIRYEGVDQAYLVKCARMKREVEKP